MDVRVEGLAQIGCESQAADDEAGECNADSSIHGFYYIEVAQNGAATRSCGGRLCHVTAQPKNGKRKQRTVN
jgi:hypothetical protein